MQQVPQNFNIMICLIENASRWNYYCWWFGWTLSLLLGILIALLGMLTLRLHSLELCMSGSFWACMSFIYYFKFQFFLVPLQYFIVLHYQNFYSFRQLLSRLTMSSSSLVLLSSMWLFAWSYARLWKQISSVTLHPLFLVLFFLHFFCCACVSTVIT